MTSGNFFKGGGTSLLQILLNNRKISLSPQEPGTCTHRNTFLTGARLLVVTAGPGSGGRRCSWCRCSVTRLHHNTSTGSTNTTARVSQTRAAQHATTPHTAHNTAHRTQHSTHTPHTAHTVLAPGPLSPLLCPPGRCSRPLVVCWCRAGRDLETRNQSGAWRWLASNTAQHRPAQQRGTTEKIGNQAEDRTADRTLAPALAVVTRPSTGRDHWPMGPLGPLGCCWATQGPRPRSQAQVTRVTPRATCHVSRGVTEEGRWDECDSSEYVSLLIILPLSICPSHSITFIKVIYISRE